MRQVPGREWLSSKSRAGADSETGAWCCVSKLLPCTLRGSGGALPSPLPNHTWPATPLEELLNTDLHLRIVT